MRKVARIIGKVLLWTGAVSLAVILVLFAINFHDEEPSDDLKALLSLPVRRTLPEQNIYVALRGIGAAAGQSPMTAGLKAIADEDRLAAMPATERPAAFDELERARGPGLPFHGKVDFCRGYPGTCWFGMAARRVKLQDLRNANQELYRRYLALFGLTTYEETVLPSPVAGVAYAPAELHRLFLASVAADALSATSVEERRLAIEPLEQDVRLWRNVLVGQGSLISKLVAQNMLCRDFAQLADLISDPDFDVMSVADVVQNTIGQIGAADWKLADAFCFEFRSIDVGWQELDVGTKAESTLSKVSGWSANRPWWGPFAMRATAALLKIQATRNLSARITLHLRRVADSDPAGLLEAMAEFHRWEDTEIYAWSRYAYNPVGHILFAIGRERFRDQFMLRSYDRLAYQHLLRLTLAARLAGIQGDGVSIFVSQHAAWSHHPVSGIAAKWDPKARTLAVDLLDPEANTPAAARTWLESAPRP